MLVQLRRSWLLVLVGGVALALVPPGRAQGPAVPDALPPLPQGVEVMDRGPVHEAFATPTAEAQATPVIPKKPPLPIEEMPPDQKPEGEVAWINGYYAWDDDRNDFLWVSGCWRARPPGKEWVAGYWREKGEDQWQWVPGFWTEASQQAAGQQAGPIQNVTYYPEPPPPPQVAPPGPPPTVESFYVPGVWVWGGERYAWRAGYWGRLQPGYVWVAGHYRWTPFGHVYIAGYWDLGVARRGVLYAPIVVNRGVVAASFVYTPGHAVCDTIVLDTLFIRPCCCHYYFGNFYGPRYERLGFESCLVYSRRHYDSIMVYHTWEHRDNPRWLDIQINLCSERHRGLAPLPGRALILAPTGRVLEARGQRVVHLEAAARVRAREEARVVQHAAIEQRRAAERPGAGPLRAPHTAAMHVAPVRPVGAPHNPAVHGPTAPVGHAPGTVGSPPHAPGATPGVRPGTAPPGARPHPPGTRPGAPTPARPVPPGQQHPNDKSNSSGTTNGGH